MDHTRGFCIPDPCLDLSTDDVLQRTPEFEDFLVFAELRKSVDRIHGQKTNFPNFPVIDTTDLYVMSRFQAPIPRGA